MYACTTRKCLPNEAYAQRIANRTAVCAFRGNQNIQSNVESCAAEQRVHTCASICAGNDQDSSTLWISACLPTRSRTKNSFSTDEYLITYGGKGNGCQFTCNSTRCDIPRMTSTNITAKKRHPCTDKAKCGVCLNTARQRDACVHG